MTLHELAQRFRGPAKRDAKGLTVYCPAHPDGAKAGRQSLRLWATPGTGGLHVRCFAGCDEAAVLTSVGLSLADVAPASRRNGGGGMSEIIAAYDYTDGAGEVLYQVVRFDPKDFRQRRPDGAGGWTWKLDGVRRVLYRLPDLAEQARLVWCEGEKDVDRLRALGIVATTSPGGADAFRTEYAQQLAALGCRELVILPDNDPPGLRYASTVAAAARTHGIIARVVRLPDLPDKGDVSDWIEAGHTADELRAVIDAARADEEAGDAEPARTRPAVEPGEPELWREGLDLALTWPDGLRLALACIRDGREGVRGELTVTQNGRRLSWGAFSLSSVQARDALRKRLEATAPGVPWGERLEDAARRLTIAAREGEPLVQLTGRACAPTREVVPRLLHEGEPTLIYADGDSGKSMFALALAVAVHSGTGLPFRLRPVRALPVAYLDFETSRELMDSRLALLAAGLGIDPPGVFYKRMTRPLADEAGALSAEFTRRGIALVIVDSMMFAVAGGDGAQFHEPVTAFYGALRLFSPAASLVLSHVTNSDAKSGVPARPFGGAFAFNSPRLIYEARRDHDVDDATAMIFTCRKANNLQRRPDPFGLRFQPGDHTITVHAFDPAEASPETVAGASRPHRITLALRPGALTAAELAEHLHVSEDTAGRNVRRLAQRGVLVKVGETGVGRGRAAKWGLST